MAGKPHPETLVLHAGYRFDSTTRATAVPIYQSASYHLGCAEDAQQIFSLEKNGNIYTRIMNPTTDVLEQRLSALEGGVGALCTASGQAATLLAVQTLAACGDNIVSSTDLYGGIWNLFSNILSAQGIEVRFVPSDPDSFARASDERTRLWYGESLPNPKLEPFPIARTAQLGRSMDIPLIIDNTTAPLICQPLALGAAVVLHSTTKYIGGHGNSIGGVIIDGGNFNWQSGRAPTLTTPDPSARGVIWTEHDPARAYILKARMSMMRDTGACLSPFNAFLLLQGLETLPLRYERQCQNAAQVAACLQSQAATSSLCQVIYPGLFEDTDRVQETLSGGFGALMGLHFKDDAAACDFINRLQLFHHVANIGDSRSLAIHPSTTTHMQLDEDERIQAGACDGYVRLSIGIEHIDDIIGDLKQALCQSLG